MSTKDRVSGAGVSSVALDTIDPTALPRRALVLDLDSAGTGSELARFFDEAVLVNLDELRAQLRTATGETCLAYTADDRLPQDELLDLLTRPSALFTMLVGVSRETTTAPAVPEGWSPRGRVVTNGVTALVLERTTEDVAARVDEAALRRAVLGADGEPAHLVRNVAAMSEAARANRLESRAEALEQKLQRARDDRDRARAQVHELRKQRDKAREQLRSLKSSPLGFLAVLSEKARRRGLADLSETASSGRLVRITALLVAALLALTTVSWAVAVATSSGYPGGAATAVVVLVVVDILLGIRGRRALARNVRSLNTTTRTGIRTHKERLDDVRRGTRELSRLTHQAAGRQTEMQRQVEIVAATSTDIAAVVRKLPAPSLPDAAKLGSRDETLQTFVYDKLLHGLARSPRDLDGDLRRVASSIMRQVQSLTDLYALVEPRRPVPQLGGGEVSADALLLLIDELLQLRPRLVVVCGSGCGTLWLALAVRRFGMPTRIVALEHLAACRQQTIDLLTAHDVQNLAEVRLAPLRESGSRDHPTGWYDPGALDGIEDVGLLFVDGPPESTGPMARYPAVPLLRDRLATEVTILLDDTIRSDETKIAELWAEELRDFDFEQLPLDKGAAVFRRRA